MWSEDNLNSTTLSRVDQQWAHHPSQSCYTSASPRLTSPLKNTTSNWMTRLPWDLHHHQLSLTLSWNILKNWLYRQQIKHLQCSFLYVDNTFTLWRHGPEELSLFLKHINSIRPSIQFTMEVEDGKILFLDVLVVKDNGKIMTKVYCNPTHTNRYLHCHSYTHSPSWQGSSEIWWEEANKSAIPQRLQIMNNVT